LPTFARNRARVTFSGRYLDAPDVRFFGVGASSSPTDQTRFGYRPITGGARLDVAVSRYLTVGGGVDYSQTQTSAGRTAPSIESRFSPADTPGLELANFTYVNSTARAAFDWRQPLGYSGRGGAYRIQVDDFRERESDRYSFRSLEAELVQLVPILRANWVIALRGLATVTDLPDSGGVPYFLMPSLGGGSTLRGYPDFRFQDRNRMLMSGELRWTPARFLDMAVFYDTGKVTDRRRDLDLEDLKKSYGIGLRVIGLNGYAFRIEAAHSREHKVRLIFSAGGAF
jgi:hemolysin activation/secretion protein